MSRYRASADFTYREPPPPARWDADRFARERDYRQVDEYYAPAPPPPRRAARPVYEDERVYYEDDRYGPRGSRVERQYFEEEDYYDPRASRGQMVPFRPARPPQPPAPPRPGLIRRQSSLDTFDRPPARRYDDYEGYRPPPRPQRISVDVPPEPSPRSNRYRPARQSRGYYDNYDDRSYYDEVAIQDPDYYGDDGFREYREREWVSRRRRDDSGSRSHSRSRPGTEAATEEVKEETKEEVKEEVKSDKKEVVRKEEIKEEVKEKPYPRRGKTRMPKRLVDTRVLYDLGYPYFEENEKTIVIGKALGPDNIDEVFAKSREYREVSTTRLIEAPPAPSAPPPPTINVQSATSRAPSTRAPSAVAPSVHESFKEDVFKEREVTTKPLSEAPRSVREWDQLELKEDDTRTVRSERPKSSLKSKSRVEEDDRETIVERKSTVIERAPSPSASPSPERRHRRRKSKSRRRSRDSYDETEIIERKIVTEEDDFMPLESDSVAVGPLALVLDRNREKRKDRDIKEQIRLLEAEQQSLRRERRADLGGEEVVKIEKRRTPSRRRRRRSSEEEVIKIRERDPSRVRLETEEVRIISDDRPRPRHRSRSRRRSFDEETIKVEHIHPNDRRFERDEEVIRIGERDRSRGRFERDDVRIIEADLPRDRSRGRFEREDVKIIEADLPRARSRSRHRSFVDEDVRIVHRSRSPSMVDEREIIVEQRGDEVVEIRKDRRDRSFSRTRAPSAGLIKAMMYAAT